MVKTKNSVVWCQDIQKGVLNFSVSCQIGSGRIKVRKEVRTKLLTVSTASLPCLITPSPALTTLPLPFLSLAHPYLQTQGSHRSWKVLGSPGIWKVTWKVVGFLIFMKSPGKDLEFYATFVRWIRFSKSFIMSYSQVVIKYIPQIFPCLFTCF